MITVAAIMLFSCNHHEEMVSGLATIADCKALPAFAKNIGFNANRTAFSTSEKNVKGIALIEYNISEGLPNKMFQNPGWKNHGNMGPMVIDAGGNCYVAATPSVNILDNRPEEQNKLYQINPATGDMQEIIDLPQGSNQLNLNVVSSTSVLLVPLSGSLGRSE